MANEKVLRFAQDDTSFSYTALAMNAVVLFARSPEREAAAKRMAGAAPLFRDRPAVA